jgi:Lhr-like helicase
VNSLGWRELRPFQDAVIPSILAGQHLIVLAPTAGGKTEAAFFPVVSRMLSEGWSGLSVLYLCPIKALLNNLDIRLQRYCTLLGRRSSLWHGDVTTSSRRKILRDPPDVLLTTPESLEVMLVSPNVDARNLFVGLQVVIVDEIHAFAGDDRGWHLLSVLERAARLAGRELQRIGLSATVGNPETLVDWLAQQLMALILQEGGIGRRTWFEWIEKVPAFSQMPVEQVESVVQWMLDHEMLWDEQGILGIPERCQVCEETNRTHHFGNREMGEFWT